MEKREEESERDKEKKPEEATGTGKFKPALSVLGPTFGRLGQVLIERGGGPPTPNQLRNHHP